MKSSEMDRGSSKIESVGNKVEKKDTLKGFIHRSPEGAVYPLYLSDNPQKEEGENFDPVEAELEVDWDNRDKNRQLLVKSHDGEDVLVPSYGGDDYPSFESAIKDLGSPGWEDREAAAGWIKNRGFKKAVDPELWALYEKLKLSKK